MPRRNALLEDQRAQYENECGIQIKDEAAEACGDVLHPSEIAIAAEVITDESQCEDSEPVAPCQSGGCAACPRRHGEEKRKREEHPQREQRHHIDVVVIRELDDDRLAGKGDRTDDRERRARVRVAARGPGTRAHRRGRLPISEPRTPLMISRPTWDPMARAALFAASSIAPSR